MPFSPRTYPSTTRSKIQAAIEQGNVLVDGTAQKKPNFKVFPLYTVSPQNMEVLLDFCFRTMCQGLRMNQWLTALCRQCCSRHQQQRASSSAHL